MWESSVAVDVVRMCRGDLVGDPADVFEKGEILLGSDAHGYDSDFNVSTAALIEPTLSNTLRFSMWSGNSTSK